MQRGRRRGESRSGDGSMVTLEKREAEEAGGGEPRGVAGMRDGVLLGSEAQLPEVDMCLGT
jgi:hypothetical protein